MLQTIVFLLINVTWALQLGAHVHVQAVSLPSKLQKKASVLNTNRRKLQALLYDLSIHIRPLASGIEGPADGDGAADE